MCFLEGRVNWGAGRGFDPTEFKAFGVPVEESHGRFREAVEIVLAAWQNERLNWSREVLEFCRCRGFAKTYATAISANLGGHVLAGCRAVGVRNRGIPLCLARTRTTRKLPGGMKCTVRNWKPMAIRLRDATCPWPA